MGSQTDLKCKAINDFISKFWDIYWLNIDSTYTQNTQQHVFKQIIVFITRSAFPSSGKIIILPLARLELNRPPPNSYLTDHRACLSSCIGMVDGMANPVSIDVLSHWWSAGNKLENYGDYLSDWIVVSWPFQRISSLHIAVSPNPTADGRFPFYRERTKFVFLWTYCIIMYKCAIKVYR